MSSTMNTLRTGILEERKVNNLQLFQIKTEGTLQGEGVAFFILSAQLCPKAGADCGTSTWFTSPPITGISSKELMTS